jgi:hypothetical protein
MKNVERYIGHCNYIDLKALETDVTRTSPGLVM